MIDEQTITEIDRARAKGATPDQLTAHYGGKALQVYMATPDAQGRRRDQINPGDPAEWPSGERPV